MCFSLSSAQSIFAYIFSRLAGAPGIDRCAPPVADRQEYVGTGQDRLVGEGAAVEAITIQTTPKA
jgi:hypothetical protein